MQQKEALTIGVPTFGGNNVELSSVPPTGAERDVDNDHIWGS